MRGQDFGAVLSGYESSGLANPKKSSGDLIRGLCPNPSCPKEGGDDRFFVNTAKRLWGCNVCKPGKGNPAAFRAILDALGVSGRRSNGVHPGAKSRGRPKPLAVSNLPPDDAPMDKVGGPWNYGFVGGESVLRKVSKQGGWQHRKDGKWVKGAGNYALQHYAPRPPGPAVKFLLVVEGEKDAVNLRSALRGVHVVSGHAGAGSAVVGLDALIQRDAPKLAVIYDADQVGREGGHEQAKRIKREYPDLVVKTVDLAPERDDGYDVSDYLAEHGIAALRAHIKAHATEVDVPRRGRPPKPAEADDPKADNSVLADDAPQDVTDIFPSELSCVLMARWFAARHHRTCKYVLDWECWIVLDDVGIWRKDERAAHRLVLGIVDEYRDLCDPKRGKLHRRVTERMTGARYSTNVLLCAEKGEESVLIEADELDQERHLLGTPSGVWDLRTKELLSADRAAQKYVTRSTAVAPEKYDCDAEHTRFDSFLEEFVSRVREVDSEARTETEHELQMWLLTQLGYALTGYTLHQTFVFLHGLKNNGKSVLLGFLKWLWGDYANSVKSTEFNRDRNAGRDLSPGHGLKFIGTRLITLSEQKKGAWDEEELKKLSAGDDYEVRDFYKAEYTIRPQCKIIISANSEPSFESDPAMVKRLRTFFIQFQAEAMDARLPEELREVGGKALWRLIRFASHWICTHVDGGEPEYLPAVIQRDSAATAAAGDPAQAFVVGAIEFTGDSTDHVINDEIVAKFREWVDESNIAVQWTDDTVRRRVYKKIRDLGENRVESGRRTDSVGNRKGAFLGLKFRT